MSLVDTFYKNIITINEKTAKGVLILIINNLLI